MKIDWWKAEGVEGESSGITLHPCLRATERKKRKSQPEAAKWNLNLDEGVFCNRWILGIPFNVQQRTVGAP